MKEYKLTKQEQETIIVFNSAGNSANIYSTDPIWMSKLKKIKGHKKYGIGIEVDVPKKMITIDGGGKK